MCPQPPSTLPCYLYQISFYFFLLQAQPFRIYHFNGPFGTKLPCWRQVLIRCFQHSEMTDSDLQFNMKRHQLPSVCTRVDCSSNSPNKSLWVAEIFVIDQNTEFNCRGVLYNRKPVSKAVMTKETHDNKNSSSFTCWMVLDVPTMRTRFSPAELHSTQTKMFQSDFWGVHLYSPLD